MRRLLASLLASLALTSVTMAAPTEPDPSTATLFKTLMSATVANDHDGFVAVCDDTMKAALTKPALEKVSQSIASHVKAGYDTDYLGELNQRGFKVGLWRLRFKDGSDDLLATMSVRDGKVGGFYLH